MPAGMQLIGKIGQDAELLQLAAALESDLTRDRSGTGARPALWG
jgi:Asp-tRNA(Asn)/Glu-tRNA(Gln) amidotransferase A subunit family amidase